MRKTVLAGAVLAATSGVANAADTVTLYGRIDTGIGYEQVRGNGFKGSRISEVNGVNSGSRFGLRGIEDLGNDLQAVFVLESGFTPSNGQSSQSSRLFGRQATLGLQGKSWGKIEFGRQTNIGSKYLGPVDPFGASFNLAHLGTTFSAAATMRLDNQVLYQSPSFGGFSFGGGYSFNADDKSNASTPNFQTSDNNRETNFGVRYASGPLYVTATYDRLTPTNSAVGGQSDARIQQVALGATYDFEVVKLHAAVGQTRDGWFVGTSLGTTPDGYTSTGSFRLADGFKATSTMLGFTVPFGRSDIFGSWQRADPSNDKLTGDAKTTNIYALGYKYDLSKRTNVYAYGAYGTDYAFQDGLRDLAFAVGLRHIF